MRVALGPLAFSALLALAVLTFVGCGGGEEETTSATTAAPEQQRQGSTSEQQAEGRQQQEDKAAAPTATEPNPPISSERIPGTKAPAPGVPVTPEGDNSIQTFGAEGETEQSEQATAELETYLSARAEGDWAGACEATSAEFKDELAKLIERAKAKPGAEKPKGCTETLALLFGKAPEGSLEAAQVSEVLSFRIRDDGYAYLIYEDPDGKVQFIAMANDEGAWKVNTVQPAPFQAASQGEAQ